MLLNKSNMLPLIVISIFTGVAIVSLGKMLIVTLFGFSPETVATIGLFGIDIDIPATFMNVTGDTVSGRLVTRMV